MNQSFHSLAPLGEFGRIAQFFRPLATLPGALALTDDAAILPPPSNNQEWVITTDAMVAGVHFFPDDPPEMIARKLLRVNISDLAAMGAVPIGYSLVVVLPRAVDDAWVAAFAAGLAEDQSRFKLSLLGGDSVSTPGPMTFMISAVGTVPSGAALTRRSEATDHCVFVSGTIGDAALGLRLKQNLLTVEDGVHRAWLLERFYQPEPRLQLGVALRGRVSAAADVSDGLVADLGHIAEVSGCEAVIEAAQVPLSEAARAVLAVHPEFLSDIITGGDDYELVVTASSAQRMVLATIAAECGVKLTEIGYLRPGEPGRVTVFDSSGCPLSLSYQGWRHS
ncbi:Thiamine-monophosphate kinase [Azospirillaceae bacterium]